VHDLTQGSITRHIIRLAAPIAAGMVFQTLYYLVDLFFVARLGDAAIAGVSAAGNVPFLVLALTQVLGVGTMVLIAHASGRRDRDDANMVFNQSLLLAALFSAMTLVVGYATVGPYMRTIGAGAETMAAGRSYLFWYLPGLALQFALVSMGSALRGTGIAKPTMVVQVITVLLNALLAPILIAGWLTGRPLGVAGAGLASTIAIGAGVALMLGYFVRFEKFVGFDRAFFRARPAEWRRVFRIGLPSGAEFALMFVSMAMIFWVIRAFGPAAQAGFGVGSRIMQAIFLPAMAVAWAAAPVAGQNVGARLHERTRATFRDAVALEALLMFLATLLCQWRGDWFVSRFTADPAVVAVATDFLRIISWNFVAQGVIFTCSGLFQALGNTVPSMISSATRIALFVIPAVWLSRRAGFAIRHIWFVSVATVGFQALFSLWLLRREFRRKLEATGHRP
jgi:putative MATE family efflux protein